MPLALGAIGSRIFETVACPGLWRGRGISLNALNLPFDAEFAVCRPPPVSGCQRSKRLSLHDRARDSGELAGRSAQHKQVPDCVMKAHPFHKVERHAKGVDDTAGDQQG